MYLVNSSTIANSRKLEFSTLLVQKTHKAKCKYEKPYVRPSDFVPPKGSFLRALMNPTCPENLKSQLNEQQA